MNQFHTTYIKSIIHLTNDAVNIEIEIPNDLKSGFSYQAGQYLVVRIPDLDNSQHRSYSISAPPFENKLQIGVKKLTGGLVSTHLVEFAKEGDRIDIMQPQGSFTLQSLSAPVKSLVAFVAGSGITPVLSIIKQHLNENSQNKALLIYGNKTTADRMYAEDLRSLENTLPIQFEDLYIYSRQTTGMKNLEGRIDVEKLISWKEYLFDIHTVDAFLICGPGNMVISLEEGLKKLGVPDRKILTELFTAPTSAEESHLTAKEIKQSHFTIEYKLNGKWHTITHETNETAVLDIGMDSGLDLPYSCKSGVCSTCQAKLLEGEVKMDNNYVLSDKELKQGYILTCQSHAMTNHLKVDYDMK